MSTKKLETKCPQCGADFLTEFELQEPETKVVVKEPDEAKLTEAQSQLKESQGKVGELEEKLAKAEGRYATLNDVLANLPEAEQKQFVVEVGKRLSPEGFVNFAIETGHLAQLVPPTEAEVAEAEAKGKVEEPKTIQGKTDRPGYRFLEHCNLSVKED